MSCLVKMKIRRGIHKRITKNQKDYFFISPIPSEKLNIGDWFLVETKKRDFAAGVIVKIYDEEKSKRVIGNVMPTSFIVCKLPNSFDDRCAKVKGMKIRQGVYNNILKERKEERKKLKEQKNIKAEK